MIKKIDNFVLSEHTNNLYKKEAGSSIALARDVAKKVNELVDAFNNLNTYELEKVHEQDGKIRKAILYMKDNLLNTINDLLNLKGDEMMDNAVKEYLGYLQTQLDNLLGSVTTGSTTLDIELLDLRVDVNNISHNSAGQSIRANQKKNISYISSGDLNTLINVNQYSIVLGSVANVPENSTGFVDIQTYRSASNVSWTIQKWYSEDGSSFIRIYKSSWSKWSALSKTEAFNVNKPLDEYVNKSFYGYVPAYTTNSPVQHAGLLDVQVYRIPNTTTIITNQIFYAYAINRVYFRTNVGGSWKEWKPINTLFDKKDYTFIDTSHDLNNFTDNFYGVALGKALNTPENDTALIDVQRHGSTTSTTYWTRQTWYSLNTGNVYYRVLIPNNAWSKWNKVNASSSGSVLNGKKVVFMGDSILGNKQDANGIVKQFETLTGANCYNFAFGGTGAKTRISHTTTWATLDGESLANAIVNRNFTSQENAVNTATDFLSYFKDTLNSLKSFDFATADYLVINYGTNDWTSGVSENDYKSAIENIVRTLLNKYPNLIIVKLKPTIRFFDLSGEIVDSNNHDFERSDNLTLKEFVKVDDTLVDTFNLQVLDTYNIGINKYNLNGFFTSPDYTHPNNEGCKRIATYLSKHIC